MSILDLSRHRSMHITPPWLPRICCGNDINQAGRLSHPLSLQFCAFHIPIHEATMRITIIPASAKTTQAAVEALLAHESQPNVVGYYRDLSKVPERFKINPRFEAVTGDVADPSSLNFGGSDAVMTLSPPKMDGSDFLDFAATTAKNVASAVRKAQTVKRLVYISSVGAEHAEGTGEIKTNHLAEQTLRNAAAEVIFIRCAYFMENWAAAFMTTAQEPAHFYSVITPPDNKVPMVSARDIGKACAEQLLTVGKSTGAGPHVFELHGPKDYSPLDVKNALDEVLGKDVEMRLVEKDKLEGFFGHFLPPKMIRPFVEMTLAFLVGESLPRDTSIEIRRGQDTLVDSFKSLHGPSA
ncbi:NAD(P)-binding protein [Myriangium duriaei CBS 260.36]|uniref:NAD(P)-binding protein n=1 Tax=Myriangium duriaei CBS 260.36 TaxID=1168546 RepID=A0A9P4ISF7_9PEZI|nr:NAD(P)-binding protein [Myriangium duriaei CBS 260.36]